MTKHPTLFVAPKQGDILQSSGFLDLQSLMSLGLTCKAHAWDELSLILLIENEITRNHQVFTLEEAIHFLKRVYQKPLLRQWMMGDGTCRSLILTHEMVSTAAPYEVMIAKMLRATPESLLYQVLNMKNNFDENVLHLAALSGNPESIRAILAFYPESQRIQALNVKDINGGIALHHAAISGNPESIKAILNLYPESQHLQIMMNAKDDIERTILHYAAYSKNSIVNILDLFSESHRLQALEMKCADGETALHIAAEAGNAESVKVILNVYPESERLRAVCTHTDSGLTALHCCAESEYTIKTIVELLPESQRLQAVCTRDTSCRERYENVLFWAAHVCNFQSVFDIVSLLPESDRWQVVNVRNRDEETVLDLVDDAMRDRVMKLLPSATSSDFI